MPCCYGREGGRECAVVGLPTTDISPGHPRSTSAAMSPKRPPQNYIRAEKNTSSQRTELDAVGSITANSGVGFVSRGMLADMVCMIWQIIYVGST